MGTLILARLAAHLLTHCTHAMKRYTGLGHSRRLVTRHGGHKRSVPRMTRSFSLGLDDEHLVRAETVRQHGGACRRHQNHVLNMPVAHVRFEGEDHALL